MAKKRTILVTLGALAGAAVAGLAVWRWRRRKTEQQGKEPETPS